MVALLDRVRAVLDVLTVNGERAQVHRARENLEDILTNGDLARDRLARFNLNLRSGAYVSCRHLRTHATKRDDDRGSSDNPASSTNSSSANPGSGAALDLFSSFWTNQIFRSSLLG